MDRIIKSDTLRIIDKVIGILMVKEEKDITEIKNISNQTIHNASVFQDECSVSIAVAIYSLSKILERQQGSLNYNMFIRILEKARKALINNNIPNFTHAIKKLFSEISKIDSKLKLYIQEVVNQSQINKGSKLCKHGVSCARASHVMGISQWELMGYLGKTKLHENVIESLDIRTRLKFARNLFQ